MLSRQDIATVERGERRFDVAPLTYRERAAFDHALRAAGIAYPTNREILRRVRQVMRLVRPTNLDEVEQLLDTAEAASRTEEDVSDEVVFALGPIERTAREEDGLLRAMYADRVQYMAMAPYEAARWALRDWSGPDLPAFERVKGLVPESLMGALTEEDILAVGFRALELMRPDRSAEKN